VFVGQHKMVLIRKTSPSQMFQFSFLSFLPFSINQKVKQPGLRIERQEGEKLPWIESHPNVLPEAEKTNK
jgi:hypothetical protein